MDYLANFIVWSLGVYGTALVLVQSALLRPFREWITFIPLKKEEDPLTLNRQTRKFSLPGKLINCIMCTGWWSGAFWSLFFWDPFEGKESCPYASFIFAGMLGSAVTWIIAVLLSPKQKGM